MATEAEYYSLREIEQIVSNSRAFVKRSKHQRALRLLNQCIVNSRHPVFYLERSNVLTLMGKYEDALEDARRALRRVPRSGEGHYAMARAQFRLGQVDNAKLTIERGLSFDPDCEILAQLKRVVFREAISLTEEQIVELRETFYLWDDDLNGFIEPAELYSKMAQLGTELSEDEVWGAMGTFDENGDGVIDFAEFVALMATELNESSVEKELRMAFHVLDTNGDGSVSISELKIGLRKLMEREVAENVDAMFGDLGLERDLTFEDFVQLMLANEFNS